MAVNVMLLGGALILQGIMGLFGRVKDPESDEKEGKKSLIISSPSQTLREGSRIPRLYGRTKIGLYPISVRIRTFKLS
jgi:predicted phage tail protein